MGIVTPSVGLQGLVWWHRFNVAYRHGRSVDYQRCIGRAKNILNSWRFNDKRWRSGRQRLVNGRYIVNRVLLLLSTCLTILFPLTTLVSLFLIAKQVFLYLPQQHILTYSKLNTAFLGIDRTGNGVRDNRYRLHYVANHGCALYRVALGPFEQNFNLETDEICFVIGYILF